MKRYLVPVGAIVLFACLSNADEKPVAYQSIKIEEIFAQMITRDAGDRVYSGQIKTATGLSEFEKEYGISIGKDDIDFKKKMLVFGVTDHIETRAFQFLKQEQIGTFTLDYADTGVKYKLALPEKGKKYSHLQVFILDRIDKMGHIGIKNLVENGLSKWYDK